MIALAVLSIAPSAMAQTSADELARAHFQSASAYYEEGRYEDAARAFSEAYRLSPRPALLENMARAYERALLFDEAIAALRRLGTDHPGHIEAPVLEERIRNLERLRARVRSGDDGPSEPTTTTSSTSATPAASGGGGSISIPGIVLLASGGALGIGSIITGAVSHSMYEELSAACPGGVCPSDRQGDISTGNALAITSTVLMFTSVAALAVGVVLLIVDQGGGSSERAALELTPGPGDAGLGVQGRF
jgi:tetratricopeptide (TPR) repeat protein